MQFKPENIDAFKTIFKNSRDKIRAMEGCQDVELLQDLKDPCVFFTYSLWDDEKQLNAYRNSELFAGVWAATKALFNDRAQAWSLKEPDLK